MGTELEGNWMKSERQAFGLSLSEVAQYADITPAYLALVETNRARPSVQVVYWVAERLGRDDVALPLWPFVANTPGKAAPVASQEETLFEL